MKKRIISLALLLVVTVSVACGKEKNISVNRLEVEDDSAVDDNSANADEEIKDESAKVEEVVEETAVEIPSEEEVLRFWANNYKDIASGKYTKDINACLYMSAVDYDGDTMPELLVGFSDGRGAFNYVRYLDVDAELKNIQYLKLSDANGNEYESEVPFEPFMMFETENGEKHYICLNFLTDSYVNQIQLYHDICIKEEDASPVVSLIKEMTTKYYEDDNGDMQEEAVKYSDSNGNDISIEEYFGESGIYNYMKNSNAKKAYRVARNVVYTSEIDDSNVDAIYEALRGTYKDSYLLEKSIEDPVKTLEGKWTLIKTSVEGDEEVYDSPEEIIVSFDEETMSLYMPMADYYNNPYAIEYISYYDSEGLWYAEVGDLEEIKWISFRLDDDGNLNMMATLWYSERDYSSIYWTFKKVE